MHMNMSRKKKSINPLFLTPIEQEKGYLQILQRRANSMLSRLTDLEGDIEVHPTARKNYYYIRMERGNVWHIPDRDTKLIDRYINKYCAKNLKKAAENGLNQLERDPVHYDFNQIDTLYKKLEAKFKKDIPDKFKSRDTLLDEWRDQPYERNPYPIDPVNQFKTDRGETVRSKMEALGCNIVNRLGLRYHVDELITLSGGKKLAPDIIIKSPRDGKFTYIEFMGLMSDNEYVKKKLRDIHEYVKAGYVPGDNLLLFTEYEDSKFDTAGFENVLRKRFLE